MSEKILIWLFVATWLIITFFYYFKKGVIARKILILVSSIWVFLVIFISIKTSPDYNDYACSTYAYVKAQPINTEVVFKKIELLHMMRHVLIFKKLGTNKFDTIFFNSETMNTYDLIKEGDTLTKKENNDSLFILKDGKPTFVNQLNCGCDSTEYIKKHGYSPRKGLDKTFFEKILNILP